LINPLVLSTLTGLAWAIVGLPVPKLIAAYMNILAAALTPCALFAIGLGISAEQRARNGGTCGKRSAYTRPGGYAPVCYDTEITAEMMQSFRLKHKVNN
jgi:Membrane transport protein